MLALAGLAMRVCLAQVGTGGIVASSRPSAVGIYDQVIADLFGEAPQAKPGTVFALGVTVRGTVDPEVHIVITQGRESTATIDWFQAKRSVHKVLELTPQSRVDPAVLAKQIGVERKEIRVASSIALEWQRGLLSSLSTNGKELLDAAKTYYETGVVDVTLDADIYDIWYEQGTTTLTAHVSEPSAVAMWAAGVRTSIEAMAKAK